MSALLVDLACYRLLLLLRIIKDILEATENVT